MWLLVARQPRPDADYWPGRRWLAALDAVAWPAIGVLLIAPHMKRAGVFGAMAAVLLVVWAVRRLQQAVLRNHRYRFTAGWFLKAVIWVLLIGYLLKLVMP